MRSRPVVISAVVVAVVVVAGLVWLLVTQLGPDGDAAVVPTTPAPTTTSEPAPSATPQDEPTSAPEPTEPTEQTTDPSPAPVEVVITIAEWNAGASAVEVAGYAAVVEEDGACELTLTRAASEARSSGTALADVSTTSCGLLTVPGEQLAAGAWQVTLTYSSSRSTGSATTTIEVP